MATTAKTFRRSRVITSRNDGEQMIELEDMTPQSILDLFEASVDKNPVVRDCLRYGKAENLRRELCLQLAIILLVSEVERLVDEQVRLMAITPKLVKLPDGSMALWDPPNSALHEPMPLDE